MWVSCSVASARARQEYLSSYYDPFAPYLDPFPSSSESPSYVIPAETLLLFAPPSHNPSAQPSSLVDYVLESAARLVVSSWASTAWDVDALEWVMPT